MALAVGGGADEEPSKHGVSSIPLFGLDRRTPSVLGQRSKLVFPVLLGFFVNLTRSKAQGTTIVMKGTRSDQNTEKQDGGQSPRKQTLRITYDFCGVLTAGLLGPKALTALRLRKTVRRVRKGDILIGYSA